MTQPRIVLAFDQATHMGWAAGSPNSPIDCGTIDSSPKRFDSLGARFMRAEQGIKSLLAKFKPALVVFEEHRAHSSVQAAQVLGAYTALIMKCCEQAGVPYMGVGVKVLKKHGTGTGNATKELMIAAARKRFPSLTIRTDDEADAAHMMRWGWEQLP